jgi:hypothetical protein
LLANRNPQKLNAKPIDEVVQFAKIWQELSVLFYCQYSRIALLAKNAKFYWANILGDTAELQSPFLPQIDKKKEFDHSV